MSPSTKVLEQALIDGTCTVFRAEPDATSVNKVRKRVAEEEGLDEEFFAQGEWKQKSKTLIKETVVSIFYVVVSSGSLVLSLRVSWV